MKTKRILFPAMVFTIAAFLSLLEARTWTEAGSGRTVDGEFVESDGENVVIKQAGGRTLTIPITRLSEADKTFISFFMKDDTASLGALLTELTYEDDSTWPAPPEVPPARNGDDPVAAVVLGIVGEGDKAKPVVACHNYDAKDVKSVSYRIQYLDADGKELDRFSKEFS